MKSSVDRLLRVCLLMSLSGSPCSNGEETEGDGGRRSVSGDLTVGTCLSTILELFCS